MAAALQPALTSAAPVSATVETELSQNRFVVSPFLTLNLSGVKCAVTNAKGEWRRLSPCEITMVGQYDYPVRNPKRIEDGPESGQPLERVWTRKPGHIFTDLMEQYGGITPGTAELPTGFCEVLELKGRNPALVSTDRALIIDLQKTLLPDRFPTAAEQITRLGDLEGMANKKGTIYAGVWKTLLKSFQQAEEWAFGYVSDLQLKLAKGVSNSPEAWQGQDRLFEHDKRVCDWIGVAYPEVASPLLKKEPFDLESLADVLANSNRDTLEAVGKMIAQALTIQTVKQPVSVEPGVNG